MINFKSKTTAMTLAIVFLLTAVMPVSLGTSKVNATNTPVSKDQTVWPLPAPGEPALPNVFIDTTYSLPTGNVISVPDGGDLQKALNDAQPGDVIQLQAGAYYMGTFTIPDKSGNGWIYITSSAYSSLPAPGTRVSPKDQDNMPKIISPNAATTIKFAKAAHNFRFVGIEIATLFDTHDTNSMDESIVDLTTYGATIADCPDNIVFDRCYIHGTPNGNIKRGITANSKALAVIDSYISEIHAVGYDNQAIGGANGPGPFKIVNNFLSAACENVIFGGSDATNETFQPQDIEIRNNYMYKPMSWYTQDPSYAGVHWSVKNIFELKNAKRILVDGNVFENHWVDGQPGPSIVLTVRNQDGGNTWATIQDLTFTNNIIKHVSAGFNILGQDYNHPSGVAANFLIRNNVTEQCGGDNLGGNGSPFLISGPADNINIDHNTFASTTGLTMALDGAPDGLTNFKFTNNIIPHGEYGVHGTARAVGMDSLDYFCGNYVFARNDLAGGLSYKNSYNTDTYFTPMTDIGFINYNNGVGGDYHLTSSSLYHNFGTDGKDLGADIDSVDTATNGVVMDLSGMPTPVPPPSMEPTPTPVETPLPTYEVGPGDFTYSFEDIVGNYVPVSGIHNGVDFGDGFWTASQTHWLFPAGGCAYFTNNISSNYFLIPSSKVLKSIDICSLDTGTTYTISDGVNPDLTGTLPARGVQLKLNTNWTSASRKVTIKFNDGWGTAIDNITYGDLIDGSSPPQTSTPTASQTATPTASPAPTPTPTVMVSQTPSPTPITTVSPTPTTVISGSPTPTPTVEPTSTPIPTPQVTFPDVSAANLSWAVNEIQTLATEGIIKGTTDGNGNIIYDPYAQVTRAQLTKLIVEAFKIDGSGSDATFSDVPSTAWYYDYVGKAYKNKIINGTSADTFGPDSPITRQDMACIIIRAMVKYKQISLVADESKLTIFADKDSIADYARINVATAVNLGIIKGTNQGSDVIFAPKDNTNRAQAAVVVYRMLNQ